MRCTICRRPVEGRGYDGCIELCRRCGRAFDRACDGVDMATVIVWVATRTRWFARRAPKGN